LVVPITENHEMGANELCTFSRSLREVVHHRINIE